MDYTIWLFVSAGIPIIAITLKYFDVLWKYRKTIGYIIVFALLVHVPWDIYAVKTGMWSFPVNKNLGIFFWHLPLEEWIFTILTPLLATSILLVIREKSRK